MKRNIFKANDNQNEVEIIHDDAFEIIDSGTAGRATYVNGKKETKKSKTNKTSAAAKKH